MIIVNDYHAILAKISKLITHCVAAAVGVADILLVRPVDYLILTAAEAEVFDGIFFVFFCLIHVVQIENE